MNKRLLQQSFIRMLLTSPIIAILMLVPIYIVHVDPQQAFGYLWLRLLNGTALCWLVQILLFSFFSKRGYSQWIYVFGLLGLCGVILLFTQPFVGDYALSDKSDSNLFLLRFSLVTAVNTMIYLMLNLADNHEKRVQLVEENARLRYNKLENDYKLLKAQINPHFLFNALNISKSLIKTAPQDAENYMIGLSEFLRRSLDMTKQEKTVSLKKELDHCQQYIALQKVRFEDALEYIVDIDDSHFEKQLPFFALTTLVENAIKHNAFSAVAPLRILLRVEDGWLVVKNNRKAKKGVQSTYTGLSNLNQRSQMLAGVDIQVEDKEAYFMVRVKLMEQ